MNPLRTVRASRVVATLGDGISTAIPEASPRMSSVSPLPGGSAHRERPTGLRGGRPRSRPATLASPMEALALVADDLRAVEGRLRALVDDRVAAVPHVARYLVDAGGKRLRPALTALGARALGRAPGVDLACAGELIHLGSLLHDDVVDQGAVRRGQPAAHVLYGNAVAVLAGDFCVARALLAAASAGARAGEALAATVADMAAGEVLQLQRAGQLDTDRDTYLDVIDRKSASLIAWCTAAEALAVGDEVAAEALSRFGRRVGAAYQITDDVLDYAAHTGKPPGADLRERKVTLPLLYAMERRPDLRDRLAAPPDDDAVAALVADVRATGALDAALADAHDLVDEAVAGLDALPEGPARDALVVLGRYLVDRTS